MTPMPTIHHGDCIEVMRAMPDASVDAIVTDPPYGLGFMGKEWDALPPSDEWGAECLRVLKPGGHLLAFGGTRTWHRLVCAIEDAGFEIRDSIAWLYGSGFPKSLDVSKAIDKAAGAEREVVGIHPNAAASLGNGVNMSGGEAADVVPITAPATPAALRWQGWGTALKPAFEPIVVARKPLIGTVAANVLAHGTGALNIDGCRIETDENLNGGAYAAIGGRSESASLHAGSGMNVPGKTVGSEFVQPSGRWPANVILDQSQAEVLDRQSGTSRSRIGKPRGADSGDGWGMTATGAEYDDIGGASRFFYTPKASKKERPVVDGVAHPTVKPLALMQYLIRLVTPPGGVVLDPFAGSGTTVEAAMIEEFACIGIERDESYLPLITARIDRVPLTLFPPS